MVKDGGKLEPMGAEGRGRSWWMLGGEESEGGGTGPLPGQSWTKTPIRSYYSQSFSSALRSRQNNLDRILIKKMWKGKFCLLCSESSDNCVPSQHKDRKTEPFRGSSLEIDNYGLIMIAVSDTICWPGQNNIFYIDIECWQYLSTLQFENAVSRTFNFDFVFYDNYKTSLEY